MKDQAKMHCSGAKLCLFILLAVACANCTIKDGTTRPAARLSAERPDFMLGHWEGEIGVNRLKHTLRVDFSCEKEGKLGGTIEVPRWGAKIELSSVKLNASELKFEFEGESRKMGKFKGTIRNAEIIGSYEWSGVTYPFHLSRKTLTDDPNYVQSRSQIPKRPFPYRTETVKFPSGSIQISAGLTLPNSTVPSPAIILVGGSGAHRWDQEIPGNPAGVEWLWVISDQFTRAGFATLQMDSRGQGDSGGDYEQTELDGLAADAIAALQYLRTRKEILQDQIGMLGHSEGADVVALATSKSKGVSFDILLSGAAIPLEEVFLEQQLALYRSSTFSEQAIARSMAKQRAFYDLLKRDISLQEVRSEVVRQAGGEAQASEGGLLDLLLKSAGTPRMRSELRYDPRPTLQKISIPTLLIYGRADIWVGAENNYAAATKALREAGNQAVTARILAGLGHHLSKTTDGLDHPSTESIDPVVMKLLMEWVHCRQTKNQSTPG